MIFIGVKMAPIFIRKKIFSYSARFRILMVNKGGKTWVYS